MCVGAGTILTTQQVDEAIEAGAEFLVSPGLNQKIVKYAQSKGIEFYPGCSSASEIELALELGVTTIKFFPSESMGGLPTIKALAAPYDKIRFMPTGGINESNIGEYLMYDKVIACGGSFMIPTDLVQTRQFDQITALCRQTVKHALGIEFMKLKLNTPDPLAVATAIQHLTMDTIQKTSSGHLIGQSLEVLTAPHLSQQGQIILGVNNIQRAIRYYKHIGIMFDEETKQYENGQLVSICFAKEPGGFSFKLHQK